MSGYESVPLHSHVTRAQRLAEVAHAGQTDKSGKPYIDHPKRVVSHYIRRAERLATHDHKGFYAGWIAAWLHDVVEDTPITIKMLGDLGFPARAVEVIDLLTYRRTMGPREAYYADIAVDPVARLVKAADMDDNTDPKRLTKLDPATAARLVEKYRKGYAALKVEPQHPF